MSEIKTFSESEIEQTLSYYNDLSKKCIYHNPKYVKSIASHFNGKLEILIYEEDNNYMFYPYIKRNIDELEYLPSYGNYDIISSWYYGGPISKREPNQTFIQDFIDKFKNHRKNNNIISEFIRFDPNLQNHETFKSLNPESNRKTVFVDLTKSLDTIWDEFEKRNRTSIRKAEKEEVEIEESTTEKDIGRFTEVYLKEMDAKDADEHYYFDSSEFKNMLERFENKFKLFITKYKGEFIGGGLVMREDGIAHDYLRSTLPDYWDYCPNNLLLYEELKWCKEQGDEIFDLQGGRPGVFNFKKAFSPNRGEFFIGKLIHDEEKYNMLIDDAEENGIKTDKDFFPQYRKKS